MWQGKQLKYPAFEYFIEDEAYFLAKPHSFAYLYMFVFVHAMYTRVYGAYDCENPSDNLKACLCNEYQTL